MHNTPHWLAILFIVLVVLTAALLGYALGG
ncbi:Uncharacterised protein [Corynebacterium kutscheri]|uniref:Uncharacterized protein n=1 Tax=Corynebacterium kutscheri TaxID=35755 RepID=A0AB38VVC3_9CORY|nr:Uncharacterised protein [Corynebacterium kutscheri]VEH10725.1 Uncharacterised protein [Corynebacterium kutscheri]VEH80789.1 Uncharacterised protein [Corynebacterium kutscheri]